MIALLERLWKYFKHALQDAPQTADAKPERRPEEAKPQPQDSFRTDPIKSQADGDPRKELEDKCSALARSDARRSWELEPDDRALKALEAKGAALALAMHRPPSEANDARKLEKFGSSGESMGK